MTRAGEEQTGERIGAERKGFGWLGWLAPVCYFHTCTGIAPSLIIIISPWISSAASFQTGRSLALYRDSRGCTVVKSQAKFTREIEAEQRRQLSLSGDEILKSRTTPAEVRRPLFPLPTHLPLALAQQTHHVLRSLHRFCAPRRATSLAQPLHRSEAHERRPRQVCHFSWG